VCLRRSWRALAISIAVSEVELLDDPFGDEAGEIGHQTKIFGEAK
jgi:hypothetical protein